MNFRQKNFHRSRINYLSSEHIQPSREKSSSETWTIIIPQKLTLLSHHHRHEGSSHWRGSRVEPTQLAMVCIKSRNFTSSWRRRWDRYHQGAFIDKLLDIYRNVRVRKEQWKWDERIEVAQMKRKNGFKNI